MSTSDDPTLNVVCLASYFKGVEFLRECKRQGHRVVLVTREKMLQEEWPRESIDEMIVTPNDVTPELMTQLVTQLARHQKIDRLVALEEYDVMTAAAIREHLRLPGLGVSAARLFRDKLAMRVGAKESGIRVPDFVHALNFEAVRDFMNRVPPPWVLKPRSDVSAVGIKKLDESEAVWRAIDLLDGRASPLEQSPQYLLERFVAGDVYHVDSLVNKGKVVFAGVNCYGRPPMEVAHQGGVFVSHTVEHDCAEHKRLLELNRRLIKSFGLERGATHAEFIRPESGDFYFLEIAARVGGAFIAETLEAWSGVNLWREWARIELAGGESRYGVKPRSSKMYGGIVLSLARQEYPDTSEYADPEIALRIRKRHHVGLIVNSPSLDRVKGLLEDYVRRFADDFCAVAPPLERPN